MMSPLASITVRAAHRIAQGGLVQPLPMGAGAERTAQGLDADDAGDAGSMRSMAMRSA